MLTALVVAVFSYGSEWGLVVVCVPMAEISRLSGRSDWIGLDFVGRERLGCLLVGWVGYRE